MCEKESGNFEKENIIEWYILWKMHVSLKPISVFKHTIFPKWIFKTAFIDTLIFVPKMFVYNPISILYSEYNSLKEALFFYYNVINAIQNICHIIKVILEESQANTFYMIKRQWQIIIKEFFNLITGQ